MTGTGFLYLQKELVLIRAQPRRYLRAAIRLQSNLAKFLDQLSILQTFKREVSGQKLHT